MTIDFQKLQLDETELPPEMDKHAYKQTLLTTYFHQRAALLVSTGGSGKLEIAKNIAKRLELTIHLTHSLASDFQNACEKDSDKKSTIEQAYEEGGMLIINNIDDLKRLPQHQNMRLEHLLMQILDKEPICINGKSLEPHPNLHVIGCLDLLPQEALDDTQNYLGQTTLARPKIIPVRREP